jgi:uncharacterized protein (TIGR02996 family)
MKAEDAVLGELLESLNEEERRVVEQRLAYSDAWDRAQTDPWARFHFRFIVLSWNLHAATYDRLQRTFGAWLEEHHDPRSEFIRLHHELAGLGECQPPDSTGDAGMEPAFLRDILAHPGDETPLLVFADWLEERSDPRIGHVRLLARIRALGRELAAAWDEDFSAPLPHVPSPAYTRFRDAARKVMQLANQEAQRLNHDYIGTQHILLALLRQDFAGATAALTGLGVGLTTARQETERITPIGPDMVLMGKLPQSRRTRATIAFTLQAADALGHDGITPEHMLLGLCRAAPCVATRVLLALGVSSGAVCERVLLSLGRDPWPWLRRHPEVW